MILILILMGNPVEPQELFYFGLKILYWVYMENLVSKAKLGFQTSSNEISIVLFDFEW